MNSIKNQKLKVKTEEILHQYKIIFIINNHNISNNIITELKLQNVENIKVCLLKKSLLEIIIKKNLDNIILTNSIYLCINTKFSVNKIFFIIQKYKLSISGVIITDKKNNFNIYNNSSDIRYVCELLKLGLNRSLLDEIVFFNVLFLKLMVKSIKL